MSYLLNMAAKQSPASLFTERKGISGLFSSFGKRKGKSVPNNVIDLCDDQQSSPDTSVLGGAKEATKRSLEMDQAPPANIKRRRLNESEETEQEDDKDDEEESDQDDDAKEPTKPLEDEQPFPNTEFDEDLPTLVIIAEQDGETNAYLVPANKFPYDLADTLRANPDYVEEAAKKARKVCKKYGKMCVLEGNVVTRLPACNLVNVQPYDDD